MHGSTKKKSASLLIFISDWFTNAQIDWENQKEFFCKLYNCHFFTLIGHSGADIDAPPVGTSFTDENMRLLRQLIIKQPKAVFLIAHGVSTSLALQLALEYPAKVKAIILISPRFNYNDRKKLFLFVGKFPRLLTFFFLFFRDPLGRNGFSAWKSSRKIIKHSITGRYLKEIAVTDLEPILYTIQQSVCLITGDKDPTGSSAYAEKMNEILSKSQLIRYAHLGHNPHRENPKTINPVLSDFIHSHEGRWVRTVKTVKDWMIGFLR